MRNHSLLRVTLETRFSSILRPKPRYAPYQTIAEYDHVEDDTPEDALEFDLGIGWRIRYFSW